MVKISVSNIESLSYQNIGYGPESPTVLTVLERDFHGVFSKFQYLEVFIILMSNQ